MKMVAEYVEHALQFERLAAHEKNPQLKADLEKQAAAYRRLAADEQKRWGCSPRSSTEELNGQRLQKLNSGAARSPSLWKMNQRWNRSFGPFARCMRKTRKLPPI